MAGFFDRVTHPIVNRMPGWVHPNHLSVARALFVVPIIIWRDRPLVAVSLLIASSIFDILDGPLARKRELTSQFGATLDATMDKIFILGALWLACGSLVWLPYRIAITGLDLILTVMRPIKWYLKVSTSSNRWGAAKTWTQSIGIGLVLTQQPPLLLASIFVFAIAIVWATLSLLGHLMDFVSSKEES